MTGDDEKTPWPAISIAEAHAILTAPGAPYEIGEMPIRGVQAKVWINTPPTLRDVFQNSCAFGPREFIVYEHDRTTYDSNARATLKLAARLLADGVGKGDRVAVIMRNLPEWPVAFFAGQLLGAIVTPLNAWWTTAELEYGLADSGAKVAIVDDERLERIAPCLDSLSELVRVYATRLTGPPDHQKVVPLEDVIGPVSHWSKLPHLPLPQVEIGPDDDATIIYTSGTTGKPKGALGTHRNMTTNIGTSDITTARNFLRAGGPVPQSDPQGLTQRIGLLAVPMFHVTGLSTNLTAMLNAGSKIVLMRRWDAEDAMRLIEAEKITSAGGVPTIVWQLLEHPARAQYDLSSLNFFSYGGAPAAPELVQKINEAFPGAIPALGWGMTETTSTFTAHIGREYENRPGSSGPAAPVGEMQVRDPVDGITILPPGVVGELWCKGPQVVKGYWNNPSATAETFVDGWLRTGDLASIDEEGFLFIADRAKDMLIRGGENIYCAEVENVLYSHPDVIDAAIVGIPHRTLGEEPGAVVQLKPGAATTEAELRAHVRDHLAAFKVPVRIAFWPESLPRNPGGKVLKSELKKVFEA